MKNNLILLTLIACVVLFAACGKDKYPDNGEYFAYWTDEEGHPWKYSMEFNDEKATYKVFNQMGTKMKESKADINQKKKTIEFESEKNQDVNVTYTVDGNVLEITRHEDNETSTYYRKGSSKQKSMEAQFKGE